MKITGFDWDAGNWPKCGKHGVSREEIEQLFREGKARIAPDVKHSTQDEGRYIAVGRVNNRQCSSCFQSVMTSFAQSAPVTCTQER